MSEWTRRILEHPVWAEIKNLGPALQKAQAAAEMGYEENLSLDRVRLVVTHTESRLAAAESALISPASLSALSEGFAEIRTRLEAFAEHKDLRQLRAANLRADDIVAQVAQISTLTNPREVEALVAAVSNARSVMERTVKEARRRGDEAKAGADSLLRQLENSKEAIHAEQQRIAQALSEFQQKFADAQERRNSEYTDALRQAVQDLAQITTEQQGQFSTAQDARSREHQTDQRTREARFAELIADYTERLTVQNAEFASQREAFVRNFEQDLKTRATEFSEKAAAVVQAIERQKVHVEKLVGVIGNLGVTSGYLTNANHARKSLWLWQFVTVCSMIALVVLAFVTLDLLKGQGDPTNWGLITGRLFLLIAAGLLAAYASRQGDRFFELEKRNRRLALELEAIGPFVAPLRIEEQEKFRLQIGERSFGKDEGQEPSDKSLTTLRDLLASKEGRQLLELVAQLIKR